MKGAGSKASTRALGLAAQANNEIRARAGPDIENERGSFAELEPHANGLRLVSCKAPPVNCPSDVFAWSGVIAEASMACREPELARDRQADPNLFGDDATQGCLTDERPPSGSRGDGSSQASSRFCDHDQPECSAASPSAAMRE
jgi:hypothetical protein